MATPMLFHPAKKFARKEEMSSALILLREVRGGKSYQ
jgi:hypothetical protein